MAYPLESLLRSPVEMFPAAMSAIAASVLLAAPSAVNLGPSASIPLAIACATLAGVRGRQAQRIVSYHRNLRRLRHYSLPASAIPWSRQAQFVGAGFEWTAVHTQRLHDALLPANARYLAPGWLHDHARRLERDLEHGRWHSISRALQSPYWQLGALRVPNPVAPLPPVGGLPALHGVELCERPIWHSLSERVGHTLVLGTTRVGKTRFAELLIMQDIRRGNVVIVFDPKGDAALLRRMYAEAKRAGRDDNFFVFHLGYPDISARYNPIGAFGRVTEVASRTANQLPDEGQSAAFKQFVWRFVNVMARALTALGRKPDYEQITRYAADIEPLLLDYFDFWLDKEPKAAGWRRQVEQLEAEIEGEKNKPRNLAGRGVRAQALLRYVREAELFDPVANALATTFSYEKSYFDKLVASLLPLMEKLTTGRVTELIAPDYQDVDDPRPIFSWQEVVARNGIVYVGLDALSDAEVAAAVGNSMFADLCSLAGQIYKFGHAQGLPINIGNRVINVHADEFNELIGPEFVPLLNKSGGAGFQVTAYTQTWDDVEARLGSAAKAEQIGGNFNSLFMLRVKNIRTAEILTNQLREVDVLKKTPVTAANDTSDPGEFADFSSKTEDRIAIKQVPLVSPADLVQLPKGQAFAQIDGGRLYKIRLPLADGDDPLLPNSLQEMVSHMERQDGPADDWANSGRAWSEKWAAAWNEIGVAA